MARDQSRSTSMSDLIYLAIGVGAFGLFAVCARLISRI
jgi:hypothetical protein